MKFFKKLKSSNFWVSMISAAVLIAQSVFDFDIKSEHLNQIILGILGLLVMSGIISDSSNDEVTVKSSLDGESVTKTLNSVISQVNSTIENTMNMIVKEIVKPIENVLAMPETNQSTTEKHDSETVAETSAIEEQAVTQTVEQPQVVSPIVEQVTNAPTTIEAVQNKVIEENLDRL